MAIGIYGIFQKILHFSIAFFKNIAYTKHTKMLPLTDGAVYKLFSVLNVLAYRWCELQVIRYNIRPHPLWWGLPLRSLMKIQSGFLYHIKDAFFHDANDPTLMANKEGGNYRPHFLAIQDSENSSIFWMVPVSSKYEKYEKIYLQQLSRYKKCTKIVLGKCGGRKTAFLIQNAFPIISDYFDHIHTSQGKPLSIHKSTQKQIVNNLNSNLRLHKHGTSLFFTDIDRLYIMMENKLKTKQAHSPSLSG